MADKKDRGQEVVRVDERTSRNVLDIGFSEVVEEAKSREQIQRMADVHTLMPPELEERKLIFPGMRNQTVLNAFRELRTKLYQIAQSQENFTLMVCSVTEDPTSSYISTNIAAAIALDQSRTSVLVDCNLYNPKLEQLLAVEPDYGLADYLENVTLDIEDIIYSIGVRRMRLIPAGSKQQPGVELFTSSRMRRFVDRLKVRYRDRYIVIDSPPLSTFADARIISDLCDFVVLIVPFGKVTPAQLDSAIEAVNPAKLAGVVFNE